MSDKAFNSRKKITLSLAEKDMALIEEIGKLTGAYTASEVVRDALRLAAMIERELTRNSSTDRPGVEK